MVSLVVLFVAFYSVGLYGISGCIIITIIGWSVYYLILSIHS